jgi:hypothetical protein
MELFEYLDKEKREQVISVYDSLKANKDLSDLHPLIIKHKDQYQKLKNSKQIDLNKLYDVQRSYGSFETDYPIIDTYSVTEKQISRAYSILDPILKALEKCDCTIKIEKNFNSFFTVNGFELKFRIKEKYNKSVIKDSKYGWGNSVFSPTGVLCFEIYESSYSVHSILETGTKPLETKIKDIFRKFFDLSEKMRLAKIENDEWRREYEIKRQKEKEFQDMILKEKQSISNIISEAGLFVQTKILRDFIQAKQNANPPSAELTAWAEWAESIADWMDPIVGKDHSFLKGSFAEVMSNEKLIRYNEAYQIDNALNFFAHPYYHKYRNSR